MGANMIYLGSCDLGKIPPNTKEHLAPYHNLGVLKGTKSFRDEDRSKWRRFREISGNDVTELQQFLFKAGFMPRGVIDGIFDYVTQASTRLFQEYVRTMEGVEKMVPDGIVGKGTWSHIDRWKREGKVSDWGKSSSEKPTDEYVQWMDMFKAAKAHYVDRNDPILSQVDAFQGKSDTVKAVNWTIDKKEIHLIGIRRNFDKKSNRRDNDDLFILLINGLVFKFWGSTDPSQHMASRKDEAFLVEGQHKYRFGWHKISSEAKVYRALRPFSNGVLVFRDRDDDNALTQEDLKEGLDQRPNPTINIHWSGIGSSNWSAGCQVLVGKSYINHLGNVIDCSKFAATSYSQLNDSKKKTKGAYNVCADLILSYAPKEVKHVYYTLGRDENLDIEGGFGASYTQDLLKLLK
ncbi:peptidoglycan-binding domain-containing protein [Flagellimonas sp. 2504JD4-2]